MDEFLIESKQNIPYKYFFNLTMYVMYRSFFTAPIEGRNWNGMYNIFKSYRYNTYDDTSLKDRDRGCYPNSNWNWRIIETSELAVTSGTRSDEKLEKSDTFVNPSLATQIAGGLWYFLRSNTFQFSSSKQKYWSLYRFSHSGNRYNTVRRF